MMAAAAVVVAKGVLKIDRYLSLDDVQKNKRRLLIDSAILVLQMNSY
jgi:hypothetical protein